MEKLVKDLYYRRISVKSAWGYRKISLRLREIDMSIRRSKLDIVLSVLSAVKDGVDKPTRIMYAANLSWKPNQSILSSLVQQGLLKEIKNTGSKRSKKRYKITEKGLNIIRYFEGAQDLIDLAKVLTQE